MERGRGVDRGPARGPEPAAHARSPHLLVHARMGDRTLRLRVAVAARSCGRGSGAATGCGFHRRGPVRGRPAGPAVGSGAGRSSGSSSPRIVEPHDAPVLRIGIEPTTNRFAIDSRRGTDTVVGRERLRAHRRWCASRPVSHDFAPTFADATHAVRCRTSIRSWTPVACPTDRRSVASSTPGSAPTGSSPGWTAPITPAPITPAPITPAPHTWPIRPPPTPPCNVWPRSSPAPRTPRPARSCRTASLRFAGSARSDRTWSCPPAASTGPDCGPTSRWPTPTARSPSNCSAWSSARSVRNRRSRPNSNRSGTSSCGNGAVSRPARTPVSVVPPARTGPTSTCWS